MLASLRLAGGAADPSRLADPSADGDLAPVPGRLLLRAGLSGLAGGGADCPGLLQVDPGERRHRQAHPGHRRGPVRLRHGGAERIRHAPAHQWQDPARHAPGLFDAGRAAGHGRQPPRQQHPLSGLRPGGPAPGGV